MVSHVMSKFVLISNGLGLRSDIDGSMLLDDSLKLKQTWQELGCRITKFLCVAFKTVGFNSGPNERLDEEGW